MTTFMANFTVTCPVERIPPLGDGAPLHWKFSDTQTALCDQGYGSERSPEEEYPPPLPEHDNQCHHHLDLHSCYPFITPESTFTVSLAKGSRGLGLSVTGGVDSGGSWPGLIRVKRLFPHQPAASCEMLNVGDLILEVNGITLTGLTNYEALEVLRTASNQVELKICRPPPDVLSCVSPISEVPPPPPRREPPSSLNLTSSSDDDHCLGEFEVTMRKLQGSLGFTLRKEDDSALGHYIRALVREPALTDSRIRAGDKIIAVNDVEISSMTHEEAVQFLRQSGEIVKLRLYRDLAQTPVATLSPTETTPRTSFSKKTQLRQEAVDMLNDIAVRKLIPGNQDIYGRRSQSPNTSPRRLRRQPCPSDASHISDSSNKYLITDEQFHEGLLKKCSLPLDEDSFNSLFIEDDDCDKPSRPSSLDLYNPNQTPVATRKPKFNFSLAHNAYELNNLDAEILDAPNLTYNLGPEDVNSTEVECGDSFPQEPASMPHIPTDNPGFSYKNPAYQSAHPQCGTENGDDKTPKAVIDDTNMKKWKGVVFTADEERERERQRSIKAKTPKNEEEDKYEILAIELNRGWNSRLGFSLQGAADSVAARDGRIKPGDCLIKVNDESVEHMSTTEIIDLLRIVRGPVCIVVSRPKPKEDSRLFAEVNQNFVNVNIVWVILIVAMLNLFLYRLGDPDSSYVKFIFMYYIFCLVFY
ncbi:PDZ domain [Popillia japonica]|uniref:PDZ domain n=1 Tax=Popillia japonica TaxID=7064 RepID=A0AAW1MEY0_POPJA